MAIECSHTLADMEMACADGACPICLGQAYHRTIEVGTAVSEKLDAVRAIFEKQEVIDVDGRQVTISDHASDNLEGAIISIEHDSGRVSEASMKTLKRVAEQCSRMAAILDL